MGIRVAWVHPVRHLAMAQVAQVQLQAKILQSDELCTRALRHVGANPLSLQLFAIQPLHQTARNCKSAFARNPEPAKHRCRAACPLRLQPSCKELASRLSRLARARDGPKVNDCAAYGWKGLFASAMYGLERMIWLPDVTNARCMSGQVPNLQSYAIGIERQHFSICC